VPYLVAPHTLTPRAKPYIVPIGVVTFTPPTVHAAAALHQAAATAAALQHAVPRAAALQHALQVAAAAATAAAAALRGSAILYASHRR